MLSVRDLHICRGQGEEAFHIYLQELDLEAGNIFSLQGLSGCGKSTLLEALGLILKPESVGQFYLNNIDIRQSVLNQDNRRLSAYRMRNFGFMLQTGGLLPFLRVSENIRLSCQLLGKAADEHWLNNLINALNIGALLNLYPHQLSIGERQRVSFLRSVAHKPQILLADEPTAALDPENSEILFDLIVDLVRQNGLAALIVTHDWQLSARKQIPIITAKVAGRESVFAPVRAEGM